MYKYVCAAAISVEFNNNSIFGRDEQSQKAFLQLVEVFNHNLIDKELTPEAGVFTNVVLSELKSDFSQNSLNPQYNFDKDRFFSKCVKEAAQIIQKSYERSTDAPGASPMSASVSPLQTHRGAEITAMG